MWVMCDTAQGMIRGPFETEEAAWRYTGNTLVALSLMDENDSPQEAAKDNGFEVHEVFAPMKEDL